MRILINERLSEHKYKTPEGYLICTDAIIARTGKQEYRKNEIFADSDDDSIIELDRPADEVFSEKTIASFENKPLVNEHPDEDVNTENYKDYAVGFIRDVHKGTVDGQDVLLANLVFTDKDAIEDIESGRKTELSCGYDCDIVDEKNPKQTNIRGNHVALCERGRAGIAKIVDSVNDTSIKDWSMKYLGHTIEEVFFGYNDDGHYCVDGNKDKRHCFETLEEAKAYIRSLRKQDSIQDNSIFYKAYVDGKAYFSDDRAELEKMNPEKIYVLEKENGLIKDMSYNGVRQVKECEHGFAIVEKKLWEKYGVNSKIERWKDNLEEARYVKDSLIKNDRIWYVIINCNEIPKRVIDSVNDAEKESKAVREAIALLEGTLARKNGYKLSRDKIEIIGGSKFPISTLVYKRLCELGYDKDSINDSIKDGKFIYVWVDKKDIKKSKYDVFEYAKANDVDVTDLGTEYRFEGEYDDVDYLFDELNLDVNDYDFDDSISDSIQDVNPRSGESKEDFISRFMSETKNEYPNEKQRLAVAYSYWKKGKGTDSMINDTYYIAKVLGTEDYALEGDIELGMKKYARKFNSENEAYSFMRKYFRVGRNDVIVEKVQDSMIKDYAVEVLTGDGRLYDKVKINYNGRYDSEIILKEFYSKHPEYKSDRYNVQIVQDSTYDETPYEKQTTELEKSEERFEDGGFQEIGDFWRNLARKNKISSQQMDDIYVAFLKTPVYQNWSKKDYMDIIYSETMFTEFMKFFKRKTGKDLIVDSVKDAWVKTYRNYSYWPDEEEANLYHVEKRENGRLIKSFTLKASTYNEALQQIKSFKDSLSYSDIDVIEDAIYWVKKSGKDLTVKNVLKQIEEDMSGFIGSNKNDIINYLKREKHLRDASEQEESLYNLLKANCNLEAKVSGGEKWRYKGNDFDSFFNKLKSIAPDLVAKSSLMKGIILVKKSKTYDEINDAMNGKLSEFNPKEFINKIQQRKQALYTERDVNGKTYTIHVDIDGLFYDKNPETVYIDVYDENHKRKTYTAKSWDEAVRVLENVKRDLLKTNDSVKDATELSAKSIDDLDEQIKRYQKLHPTWKFGEIRKERGLYRVNVITDSMKDAQTYVIKYKLLEYNTMAKREFKANSVEEALKKFAREIALEGIGTYNVFVGSISPNDGYISLYGRLSKLLDEFNIKWYDSVKDSKHIKAIKAIKAIKQHQDSKLKDDYSGFLGNYGFGYLKGSGDYEYWYYKDKNDINTFNKVVERIRKEYPSFIVSSIKSDGNPRIYIQKSKYGVKDSKVKDDDWDFMRKVREVSNSKLKSALKEVVNSRLYKDLTKDDTIKIGELRALSGPEKEKLLKKLGLSDSKVKDDNGKVEIINGTKYASSPRGKFKISTLKRSDAEKQGYGYHHTIFTPEGRYDVMIKNNSAIAVINE